MKRRFMQLGTAILLTGSLVFSSCDKDNDDATRSELIVGTWTLNAYGQDDNMNGILETAEHDVIPPGANLVEVFKSDHTGSITSTPPTGTGGGPTSYNITWQFQNNDQQLVVTNTSNSTSSTANVTLLNNNQFMGYDPASSPRIIYLLTK